MTIYYYTNTSPGAPTLTGAAGSLITLLDWLLVTNLGWTKEFSGTNLASYRAATGNRFYLGVDDTTTLYSRVRGFETMTAAGVAVASGTGPFPTDAQLSGGKYVRKTDGVGGVGAARQWRFISNGRMFYLSSNLVDPSYANTEYNLTMFGDIESFKSADVFNTVLSANSDSTGNTGCMASSYLSTTFPYPAYLARSYTQAGGSTSGTRLAVNPYGIYGSTQIGSNASIAFPSPVLGGLHMDKVYVADGTSTHIRGVYPGMYFPLHARPLENESTFHGNGEFSGRTFVVWNVGSGGQIFIENTGGWGE